MISFISNTSIGEVGYFLYTLLHFKCICYFPFYFFFSLNKDLTERNKKLEGEMIVCKIALNFSYVEFFN